MPVCNHPDYGHYRDDEAKTQYPMFKASPGDWLWVKWKDNGHITKDPFDKSITGEGERAGKNPPYDQGKVWIYGSEKMDNVTYKDVASVSLKTVRSGSWKDGELLAESPYDDGLCAEENETLTFLERCKLGGGGPCKVAVQIPPSVKGTKYTLIYVWDYSGKLGRPAVMVHWFTSCLDIEILPGKKPTSTEKPPKITPARLVTQDEHLAHLQKGAKPSEAELVCKKKKLVKRSSIPGFSPSAKFRF
ncbi:hypothetical protein EX30DRAFT_372000 [Ascodesmis nigricans]|uniref:DUF7492 domain-containing protein n=1 Tax=Ascodesmis nigricans TaxID=341454 RepID=A0A4S2MVK9_9PEZI|nr:hypothetical protein EX30DRAFT_372000 [Ascodesmis nigricans]